MRDRQYYEELECEIREILKITLEGKLPQDVADVEEYLDVGEYGVAHHHLCAALVEEKITISQEAFSRILSVGRKVGFRIDLEREVRLLVQESETAEGEK